MNIKELKLWEFSKITDYSIISKLSKLEKISFKEINLSNISLLENNKSIKEINIYKCRNSKNDSFI